MDGLFTGMLSIRLRAGEQAAIATASNTKLWKRATSLGGVESLVEHRHTIEDTVPETLIRLSCGIESEAALIGDLERALLG